MPTERSPIIWYNGRRLAVSDANPNGTAKPALLEFAALTANLRGCLFDLVSPGDGAAHNRFAWRDGLWKLTQRLKLAAARKSRVFSRAGDKGPDAGAVMILRNIHQRFVAIGVHVLGLPDRIDARWANAVVPGTFAAHGVKRTARRDIPQRTRPS